MSKHKPEAVGEAADPGRIALSQALLELITKWRDISGRPNRPTGFRLCADELENELARVAPSVPCVEGARSTAERPTSAVISEQTKELWSHVFAIERFLRHSDHGQAGLALEWLSKLKTYLPDVVCEHGTAMDVHCCGCHSGFLFDSRRCVCFLAEAASRLAGAQETK